MPDPYQELALSIDARARQVVRATVSGLSAELGRVTPNGLKLDGFAHEIRDYKVAAHLTLPASLGSDTGGDTLGTPEPLRSLRSGDWVLVIPVNRGRDHVVIARVTHA